jgi:RNA:NAD 2'-phosphotransferase (TPT1/KptA family)
MRLNEFTKDTMIESIKYEFEWDHEPVSIWYHGTSLVNYKKILKSGYMEPRLADCQEYGKAVWFTKNIEDTSPYKDTIILAITNQDAKDNFKCIRDGDCLIIKNKIPTIFLKKVKGKSSIEVG